MNAKPAIILMLGVTALVAQDRPRDVGTSLNQMWSRGKAAAPGPVKFSTFPLRAHDLEHVIPMGMMVHAHVTPSDHLSLQPKDRNAPGDRYEVLAPGDGFIVDIHRPMAGNPDPGVRSYSGDFRIVIEHSGSVYTWFGLIDRLDQSIITAAGGEPAAGQPVGVRIPVKSGQVIGRTGGGHGVDFTVINTDSKLRGFIKPERFQLRDQWKPHVTDPFLLVAEPVRSQLLALNPRKQEPRGGRIDYDIAGTLAGSWYQENSGGYAGLNRRMDYWVGHLAIAYHHIDPSKIVVSVGDFGGKPAQYWVKGNKPDPATIGEKDGIVKYELVYAGIGSNGNAYEGIPTGAQGTVLCEVLPDRKLKFEAFPGRQGRDVKGFTENAATYER